jgi:hypothetical protein
MHINAVADSVILYVHVYDMIFKINQIIYCVKVSPPPAPQGKILGAHVPGVIVHTSILTLIRIINTQICAECDVQYVWRTSVPKDKK